MLYVDAEMKGVLENTNIFLSVYIFAYSLLSVLLDLLIQIPELQTVEVFKNEYEVERKGVLPLTIQGDMKGSNENLSCCRPSCRKSSF